MTNSARATADQLTESLILVDEHDQEVGFSSKQECHAGDGVLHRAFSIFLFNDNGELLLQRRSNSKPLWPMYWSNSCCSHPHQGEPVAAAAQRRLHEELGVSCELDFLYKFIYQAKFGDVGAEYEYCWVYAGRYSGQLTMNREEIAESRFVHPDELSAEINANGDEFTPWLKLEWQRISTEFLDRAVSGPG